MRNQLFSTVAFRATDDAAQSGVTADVQAHADKLAAEATTTAQAKLASANAKRAASKQSPKPSKPAANAKPSTGKRGKQAVVVQPAKPARAAQPIDAQRAKLTEADHVLARRFYDQSSLAVHSRKPCKRADYAARVVNPVQRADNPTVRDESALALMLSRASKAGSFDPCAGSGLDLGCVSRAASLGFIRYDAKADDFAFTTVGLARARAVVKRAA